VDNDVSARVACVLDILGRVAMNEYWAFRAMSLFDDSPYYAFRNSGA